MNVGKREDRKSPAPDADGGLSRHILSVRRKACVVLTQNQLQISVFSVVVMAVAAAGGAVMRTRTLAGDDKLQLTVDLVCQRVKGVLRVHVSDIDRMCHDCVV